MSRKRSLAIVLVCGFFSVLVNAAFDGSWPDFSLARFLVFIGGLVVISFGFNVLQAKYDARKSSTQS
jgi:hypothetical protein